MFEYSLEPHVEIKPWGGKRLSQLKSLNRDHDKIGETWECSTHKSGESKINGKPLSSVVGKLKFLVKLIHAEENLSIQVHPDDAYAQANEFDNGKDECWYIVETTKANAGIYLGMKETVTREKLEECIREKKDLSKLVNFYPVKKGDFFIVPAGTIHAIGEGVVLAEVQQASGITYRVWDWNRVDEQGQQRELKVEKALDVIKFKNDFLGPIRPDNNGDLIWQHRDFKVSVYNNKLTVADYTVEFQIDLKNEFKAKILTLGGR